jgi:hypothetical protein
VFGVIHAGLIVIGYYTGWSINRLLKIASNGYIAGIFGAIFAHVIADLIASLVRSRYSSCNSWNFSWWFNTFIC